VLLDELDEQQAIAAAQEILTVIATPITLDEGVIRVSVSAGITFVRPGHGAEDLLHQADLAMYRAKTIGPVGVAVYDQDLEDWALARKHQVDRLAERLEELHAENRALAEAATIDQRTGLPNPATFDVDHARRNRAGEPYSLLLVDIDRFHSYNTLYRYLAGHETLRKVAEAIDRTPARVIAPTGTGARSSPCCCRARGWPARWRPASGSGRRWSGSGWSTGATRAAW
jgi:GGDEF domain-containing protein